MRQITREEWDKAKRHGYTHRFQDGTKGILTHTDKGTVLEPVTVEGNPKDHWLHRPVTFVEGRDSGLKGIADSWRNLPKDEKERIAAEELAKAEKKHGKI